MATDFYEYKGIWAGKVISLTTHDYPLGHKYCNGISSACFLDDDGDEIMQLSPRQIYRISTLIRERRLPLVYFGGWSPDGSYWGPQYDNDTDQGGD